MQAVFDPTEESRADASPLVGEADVVGLYPADSAVASRFSACENPPGGVRPWNELVELTRRRAVRVVFDLAEELRDDAGPFVAEVDVVGLYRPDVAAAVSRATACDPGSGPTQIDD